MHSRNSTIGSAGLVAAIIFAEILAAAAPRAAFAVPPAAATPSVHELATQIAEEWLKEQGVTRPAVAPSAPQTNQSFGDYINSTAGVFHDQIVTLVGAIPDLPNEFDRAVERVTAIDADAGHGQVFLDLGIFGDKYRVASRRLAAGAWQPGPGRPCPAVTAQSIIRAIRCRTRSIVAGFAVQAAAMPP